MNAPIFERGIVSLKHALVKETKEKFIVYGLHV